MTRSYELLNGWRGVIRRSASEPIAEPVAASGDDEPAHDFAQGGIVDGAGGPVRVEANLAAVWMMGHDGEWQPVELAAVTPPRIVDPPIVLAEPMPDPVTPSPPPDLPVDDLREVLLSLVPAEDWITDPELDGTQVPCVGLPGHSFKVGNWIVPVGAPTAAWSFGSKKSPSHGTMRLGRGVYLYNPNENQYLSPRGCFARAISLKLALDTDPDEIDQMACGA